MSDKTSGLDRTAYNYGNSEYNNSEGQGNAMADAISAFLGFASNWEPILENPVAMKLLEDLEWAEDYWRTRGGTEV